MLCNGLCVVQKDPLSSLNSSRPSWQMGEVGGKILAFQWTSCCCFKRTYWRKGDPQSTVNWFPGCHRASATGLPPRRPVPCSWQCWALPKIAAFKTDQPGGRTGLWWSWLFNVQAKKRHSPLPLFNQHPQEEQDPHRPVSDSLSEGPSCSSCQSSC